MAKTEILALRALAERIETGESRPMPINIEFVAAWSPWPSAKAKFHAPTHAIICKFIQF